jgi:hypothetical protein
MMTSSAGAAAGTNRLATTPAKIKTASHTKILTLPQPRATGAKGSLDFFGGIAAPQAKPHTQNS